MLSYLRNYSLSHLQWHFRKICQSQSLKLELLLSRKCDKRDIQALCFTLWNSISKYHRRWDRLYMYSCLHILIERDPWGVAWAISLEHGREKFFVGHSQRAVPLTYTHTHTYTYIHTHTCVHLQMRVGACVCVHEARYLVERGQTCKSVCMSVFACAQNFWYALSCLCNYSLSHLRTSSKALSKSKLKAETSLFTEMWQQRCSSFELCALEQH